MQYQKEEVKKRILDAAVSEFQKEGYYKASILRIATRAKVPIGNLYRYFKGKEALFEAIVGEAYTAINDFMNRSYENNTDGIKDKDDREAISVGILTLFEAYRREFLLLLDKSQGSKYSDYGEALRKEICALWKKYFKKDDADGDAFMIEILAEGFIGGVLKILRSAPGGERAGLLERLLKFYFQNIKERLV